MNSNQIEELFFKHEAQIAHHAWSWHRTTGLDVEELMSVGRSAFMKATTTFDENRASFSTHLHHTLYFALRSFARSEYKKGPRVRPPEGGALEAGADDNHFRSASIRDWIQELSEEARFVASLIIESPSVLGLNGTEPPKIARGKVVRFLKKLGWKQSKRWDCIAELRARIKEV